MAETPRLVTSMGKAELDRIFVRGYDLNEELMGKVAAHAAAAHGIHEITPELEAKVSSVIRERPDA